MNRQLLAKKIVALEQIASRPDCLPERDGFELAGDFLNGQ